jgi:hypothetical protein
MFEQFGLLRDALPDNGSAFFTPSGRGMSHNRRASWECQLTQQNGGMA